MPARNSRPPYLENRKPFLLSEVISTTICPLIEIAYDLNPRLNDFGVALMSTSPEDATAECQLDSSRSSLLGSSNGSQQAPAKEPGDKPTAPIEKTISCVSCRKRKLKCDRVKPKCSTCTRLRHECEYPERRRNLGSKRRNMKELEARLGAPFRGQLAGTMLTSSSPGRNTTRSRDYQGFLSICC